ncbi:hypothetical protein [Roseomonas elaeocarpi]|uniref:Uncharacterized protein n=1 Tax=Roseomonas elaeocarpi TaxID=907779 RepID=A0ABV6JV91_9PROT
MSIDSHLPGPQQPSGFQGQSRGTWSGRDPRRDDRRRSERLAEGGIVAGLMLASVVATAWMLGGGRQLSVAVSPQADYRLEFWRPTRVQQILHPLHEEPALVRLYRVTDNCLLRESDVIDLSEDGEEARWAVPDRGEVSVGQTLSWEGLPPAPGGGDCPELAVE